MSERLTVFYPSGTKLNYFGTGKVGEVAPGILGVWVEAESSKDVVVLDPRAVIVGFDDVGQVVRYNGRKFMDHPLFMPEMKDWLAGHPEWPPEEIFSEIAK